MDQHITLSGDLGSGKSTVARLLSQHVGFEIVASGDVQRTIATELGLSTLQVNWMAEQKSQIDEKIDGALANLNEAPEKLIIDARLGWHFVRDSFKIHLLVDSLVGAQRLLAGRYSAVEEYTTLDDARAAAEARAASERRRFLEKYKVDIVRLRNYDLVVDTSLASPEQVAATIIDVLDGHRSEQLFVSPQRIFPLEHAETIDGAQSPQLIFVRPFFYLYSGLSALNSAMRDGTALIGASLVAEGDELTPEGVAAAHLVAAESNSARWGEWEQLHAFQFDEYPTNR